MLLRSCQSLDIEGGKAAAGALHRAIKAALNVMFSRRFKAHGSWHSLA